MTPLKGSAGAALRAVAAAGLLDVWRDWVRLLNAPTVTLEAQARRWAQWIDEGQADALREQASYIIESGYYENPTAALRKRLQDAQLAPAPLPPAPGPSRPPLRPGMRVRYPDGSEATVVAVLSRGIATDHPEYPDIPLSQVRGLEVIE